MKNIWIGIAVVLAFAGVGFAQTYVSGIVSGEWDSLGSPYVFVGQCSVAVHDTLTIGPGVEILASDSSYHSLIHVFDSYGRLFIEGDSSAPVLIRGVTIWHPSEIKYAVIESCRIGVFEVPKISNVEIRYCDIGIDNGSHGWSIQGEFLNIHHCTKGFLFLGNSEHRIQRSLFHHNTRACEAVPEMDIDAVANFEYCTFANNGVALLGYFETWDWYHCTLTSNSNVYFKNSIIADTINDNGGWHRIYNCYYPFSSHPDTLIYTDNPCFIDTALWNYHLQSCSPYIDVGIGMPPDSFLGLAPDIGAYEYDPDHTVMAYELFTGWNLLSVPFSDTFAIADLFPFCVPHGYAWNNQTKEFYEIDTVTAGIGFFLISPLDTVVAINGTREATNITDTLYRGWNLIGAPSIAVNCSTITDLPDVISEIFGFDAESQNYNIADYIRPGSGYWLFTTDTLELEMP